MTIAVDLGREATKQTNSQLVISFENREFTKLEKSRICLSPSSDDVREYSKTCLKWSLKRRPKNRFSRLLMA